MGILLYEMAEYPYFITVFHLNSPGGPACNYLSFYTAVARAAAGLHCLVSGAVDQRSLLGALNTFLHSITHQWTLLMLRFVA